MRRHGSPAIPALRPRLRPTLPFQGPWPPYAAALPRPPLGARRRTGSQDGGSEAAQQRGCGRGVSRRRQAHSLFSHGKEKGVGRQLTNHGGIGGEQQASSPTSSLATIDFSSSMRQHDRGVHYNLQHGVQRLGGGEGVARRRLGAASLTARAAQQGRGPTEVPVSLSWMLHRPSDDRKLHRLISFTSRH